MKIGIIGLGYVGLSTSLGLAELGHEVIGYEIDSKKLSLIKKGIMPIYEEGMQEILEKTLGKQFYPTDMIYNVLEDTIAVYICVPTPSKEDGSIDLKLINEVAKSISEKLVNLVKKPIIIIKSTVIPGTTRNIKDIIAKESKINKDDFKIAMLPEFLRQGTAYKDFMKPDRIIFGIEKEDQEVKNILIEKYAKINSKKVFIDIETAEFSKYASNSFLAMKISFANELANIVDAFNLKENERKVNVDKIVEIMGLDNRINPKFLGAGPGFGGSCFPKDVKALAAFGRMYNQPFKLLETVTIVNANQAEMIVEKARKILGSLEKKKIGIIGLAFKPNTDDIRDTPAKPIIEMLLKEKSEIFAWDPKAEERMKKELSDITYHDELDEFIKDKLDLAVLLTNWKEVNDYYGKMDTIPFPILDTRRTGIKTKYKIGNTTI